MLKKLVRKIEKYLEKSDMQDYDFYPPATEILQNPPSPAGRCLVWIIVTLFVLSIIWAFVGEIDEVVVAQGKVIPVGHTKTLQAEDKGIVKNILVKNGQHVKKGDILLELDPTYSESDLQTLKKNIAFYELNMERINAELNNQPFVIKASIQAEEKDRNQQLNLYRSRQQEKNAKLDFYNAQVNQKRDAVKVAYAALSKNEQQYAIAKDKEISTQKLWDENAIGYFQVLDYRGQRIEYEQNIKMIQAQLSAAETDVKASLQEKAQFVAEWNRQLQEEMLNCRKEYQELKQAERKADLKNRLIAIKAPVDGVVHQLEIHTDGAVVQAAEPLLSVVPEGTPMEIEAWMENKDVGFVHPNQEVEVKVEAFNFQKFGVLRGKVREISADSIEDKQRGQIYRVMISLDTEKLYMDNKVLPVYPGMNVSAEIKTRKKRIIDFFLEPFQTYKSEALRER